MIATAGRESATTTTGSSAFEGPSERALLAAYFNLPERIAHSEPWWRILRGIEDVGLAVADAGFERATALYDTTLGPFMPYAIAGIRRRLLQAHGSGYFRRRRMVSLGAHGAVLVDRRSPESRHIETEELRLLRAALGDLPDLRAFAIEGRSRRWIAARRHCAPRTVGKRIRRQRAKLKEALQCCA